MEAIDKKKIRILHIAPGYDQSDLYPRLIESLLEKNCDNQVYVQSKCHSEKQNKWPVYYLGREFNIIDRLLFFRKQKIILNDILQRDLVNDINVIHAHNLFSAGYNSYLIKKKYNIPYIVAVRNADVNAFFNYMIHLRGIGVKIMREASKVIFLSPAYKTNVIQKFVPQKYQSEIKKKSVVIPNGIDGIFLKNIKSIPRTIDKKRIKLIYVGNVDSNKNIDTTIKVCDILKAKGYSVVYTIVGKIKEKKYEYIINDNRINYHHQVPIDEVINYLDNSDVFIMPSIHETFGLVYVEAMTQGLPIIYSKGQGFDGFFEQGVVGYSVPCFDELKIATSVEKIFENYTEISNNCLQASKMFSWNKIADNYINIYNDIITEK